MNKSEGDQISHGTNKGSRGSSTPILDIISKLAAPVATVFGAIIGGVFLILVNGYQSKMSGITLLNQREQAESNLRATMFQNLINPIVGNPERGQEIEPERELLLTELLALNFDEHIELKPLMLLVDQKLAAEKAEKGRKSLQSIARRVIDRQINVLRMEGEKAECAIEPVEMYFAENPPVFLEADLLPGLASKLKDGSALSSYLRENFSTETQNLLNAYNPDQPESFALLQMTLADELNKVINRSSLYDKQRFQGIKLSQKARELIEKKKLKDQEISRLNWLLLKDAYPEEIMSPNSSICQGTAQPKWRKELPGWKMPNSPTMLAAFSKPVCTSFPGKEHGFPENSHILEVSVVKADFENDRFSVIVLVRDLLEAFNFELTRYDFPFTDNTAISSDFRFALVVAQVHKENRIVSLKLVWFPPKYITPRERPINYREMRKIIKKEQ